MLSVSVGAVFSKLDFYCRSGTITAMSRWGYYRVAAVTPRLRVADVAFNLAEMLQVAEQLVAEESVDVLLFPELGLTGYSCGDLFYQSQLVRAAKEALLQWAAATAHLPCISVVGLPLQVQDGLYNVAALVQGGEVKGLVPKSTLPNYAEFYEKRQFRPARDLAVSEYRLAGRHIPLGADLLFSDGGVLSIGIEICEDLWSLIPPSSYLAEQGARLILNPSASNDYVGKAAYRRSLVSQQSARCLAAYAYSSAGVHESTQDVVYSGHALIADNGSLLAESRRYQRESSWIVADVDLERLGVLRQRESSFHEGRGEQMPTLRLIHLDPLPENCDARHAQVAAYPFLPSEQQKAERCEEILAIQSHGLAQRMEHSGAQTLIIGVSGGLDSTLALLVAVRACELLGRPASTVKAITMPGFGTTGRTYQNALSMMRLLGVEQKEIDIKGSCKWHFKDIGFNPALRTNTYENVQARERTKILMNMANMSHGLVVGTGDLSEIALGWSTYNGDHMSMYAVNCSVPKTLIRCLIEHIAQQSDEALSAVLLDINATPVSPELLPPAEDGSIEQCTEQLIGPYALHDFFLYHFIKHAASPKKILFLARKALGGEFDNETIEQSLRTFVRRFFSQQFKRSCIPDGPKVGSISLSPRGDWRMPSDAHASLWLSSLD